MRPLCSGLTQRPADAATPRANRGRGRPKGRRLPGFVDGHAAPLTQSLGPRVEGVFEKGPAQSRPYRWRMGRVRAGALVTTQVLSRPMGRWRRGEVPFQPWRGRSAKAGRVAVVIAEPGPVFAGGGRDPAVAARLGAGAQRGRGVGRRKVAFASPAFG